MTQEFKILDTTFSFKGLKAEIKTFEDHLHKLTHIKSYKMERSGIIGKEEIREMVFFIMFGQEGLRDPEGFETKKKNFLAEYNGKTLTVQNLPIIKAQIKEIFDAHVSLEDKTQTPEQHQAELVERNKLHAEIDEKHKIEAEHRELAREQIKKEYPYLLLSNKDISSRILATKNIRLELGMKYPGHKFSITSDTFSMGDSIDVRWEDGVTEKEVNEIIRKYQEGHFDGMNDIYEYGDRVFNTVFGGAKYVHANRTITRDRWIEVGQELGYTVTFEGYKMFVVDANGETGGYDGIISRELSERSFYKKVENQSFSGETKEISSESGIIIQENKEKEGIEIKFPGKPSPEVLSKLKGNGFRWNGRTKVWYKRRSENALIFAKSLIPSNGNNSHQDLEEGLITESQSHFERTLQTESQSEKAYS